MTDTVKSASEFIFVGVSTRSSAVVPVFEAWSRSLGRRWNLVHCDIPVGAPSARYEDLLAEFRHPEVVGGLITTHKAALYAGHREGFDLLEPRCVPLAEVGIAFKREGELCGGVSDVASGGLILGDILNTDHWHDGSRSAVVLGAGGAGLAAAWNLAVNQVGAARQVTVIESDTGRFKEIRDLVAGWPAHCEFRVLQPEDGVADAEILRAGEGSLVVNATGLGKDRPGSPVSAGLEFPNRSTVWDFNYRGEQTFLGQARAQADSGGLVVHDGFDYFACGWSVVMSRVAGLAWHRRTYESFLLTARQAR